MADEQAKLSPRARQLIQQHADSLFISSISGFEIAIKYARGVLRLPIEPVAWLEIALPNHGISELPVTCRIGALAASLPPLHKDPCDRIIVATAVIEGLTVLTPDPLIRAYPDAHVEW